MGAIGSFGLRLTTYVIFLAVFGAMGAHFPPQPRRESQHEIQSLIKSDVLKA